MQFRVSAGDRARQFGILKSVGATRRQIVSSVMYESAFLSAVGIPAGVIVGLIAAFAGVRTANQFPWPACLCIALSWCSL
jgi:putative ABC transport system permease protein